ncbi:MAG: ABC transporter permease [Oscillospiraceae bacterium]|nr:ABC transporter permease [Oscillospiraceae bacterium]
MTKYVIKRLLGMIPMLVMIILIVFFILNITPGNPAVIILGKDAAPEAIAALEEELGLNNPFFERYVDYLKGVLQLDFGESYRSGKPVFDVLLPKFPTTLKLAILSVIATALLGIPLGIISAVRQYSKLDIGLTVSSLVLASVPGFWLSLMMILFFSVLLGILPSTGYTTWQHYVMPVLSISVPAAAYQARITRNQMLETMRQDYIRTAKAKGADKQRIIWKHALKNTLMPVVTTLGMRFATMLGGSMITELIYGLPGIGNEILNAITMKDTPVILGSTIFLGALFMIIMLMVDIIYAYIDPRTRAQFK